MLNKNNHAGKCWLRNGSCGFFRWFGKSIYSVHLHLAFCNFDDLLRLFGTRIILPATPAGYGAGFDFKQHGARFISVRFDILR